MAIKDFYHVRNFKSVGKLNRKRFDRPILQDLVVARFIKGDTILHYKLSHTSQSYEKLDFVKSNIDIKTPFVPKETPRDLNVQKKVKYVNY